MFGQSLLSAFGSAACTTDTNQLFTTDVQTTSVATYQFNNATTSIPSNTYPGAASNITYATGKFGDAAVFNGSSSVVDISSSAGYPGSSVYTVSMWLNINDVTAYQGFFVNVSSPNIVNQFAAVLNSGRIDLYAVHTSGNTTIDAIETTPQTPFVNNTWYNVVIIADRSLANKAKVFVNNTENTYNYRPNVAGTTAFSTARIGNADNNYFGGLIDQVRIFNSSLPRAAVTALYNETTTTAQSASVDYQLVNPNSIAYYKMSDAADQLGNYNGTATDVNFNTVGKFGFAGGFNGSSGVITTSLDLDTLTNYTISMWVNPSSLGKFLAGTINSAASNGIYFYLNSDGTVRFVERTTSSNTLTSTDTISTNTWNHLVFVRDGSTNYIYVNNGTPVSISNWNITNSVGFTLARGGDYTPVNTAYYNGSIDQVRIYDSAVSAANVTTLYEEIECPAVTSDTYLVVGGGGGSGSYGGGGAGGYLSNFNRNSIEFTTGTVYTITVGAGGTTSTSNSGAGTNGDSSVLSGSNITTITASGGGYGGNVVYNVNANSGASGGGGASDGAGVGGAASPAGQGNAGGVGAASHPNYSGGGGGGAGAVGNAGTTASGAIGGNGGVGVETSITGTATYFAGGGGGTGYDYPNPGTSGTGGSGGGGTANPYGSTSTVSNATPNTGGGGGGNGAVFSNGSGGSGIVVLRYSSTKSITIASGNLSTGTLNTSVGSDKYTTFIGGTGTVTFS